MQMRSEDETIRRRSKASRVCILALVFAIVIFLSFKLFGNSTKYDLNTTFHDGDYLKEQNLRTTGMNTGDAMPINLRSTIPASNQNGQTIVPINNLQTDIPVDNQNLQIAPPIDNQNLQIALPLDNQNLQIVQDNGDFTEPNNNIYYFVIVMIILLFLAYSRTSKRRNGLFKIRVLNSQEGTETEFDCDESTYILDAAEKAGIDLPYSCRAGACASCAGRVVKGCVDQSEQAFLDEKQQERYCLTCIAYPTSDLVIESHAEEELMKDEEQALEEI